MGFLDDVLGGLKSVGDIVQEGRDVLGGFQQNGTDPRPPIVQSDPGGMSVGTWVLIGIGGAVLLYVVLRKRS